MALLVALSKIAGLLASDAYVDIVAVVYRCLKLLMPGNVLSRIVWIASSILISLCFVVVSVLLTIELIASDVHDIVDRVALFVYNSGTGISFSQLPVLVVVNGFLSRAIYWLIIVIGYIIHVLVIIASLAIAIKAVVLGVYTALMFDAHIRQIRTVTRRYDTESR